VQDGAYVLVMATYDTTGKLGGDTNLTGQIYRLGTNVSGGQNAPYVWNLVPGSDINRQDSLFSVGGTVPIPNATTLNGTVTVFVLGSPLVQTSDTGAAITTYGYQGKAQDITAVSGFIRVSN
jgi:hypothetical protein